MRTTLSVLSLSQRGARPARVLLALVAASALLLDLAAPSVRAADSAPPAHCEEVSLPVALAPGAAADYQVVGWLCARPPLHGGTVHVLLSGATYSHLYWDFPLRPERYSYVRALNDAGYATLNLDRIGIGQSDHPPAEEVTVESNAFVVHQLVQALRDGRLAPFAFSKVILVGHSLGSAIALVEAYRYADVDGLIISGFLHTFGPTAPLVPASFYPAELDPRFQDRGLPPGYKTTLPNTRGPNFYYLLNAESDVVALDEATKETLTQGEFDFLNVVVSPEISQGISVPVLVAIGAYDTSFCTPPACPEAAVEGLYYSFAAQLERHVVPDAGHDLNLQINARAWYALARDWSDRHFGS